MTLLVMNLCLPGLSEGLWGGLASPESFVFFFFYLGPAMTGYEVNLSKEVVLPYAGICICAIIFLEVGSSSKNDREELAMRVSEGS